jgi:outer membrane lipoprotein LolB
LSSRLFVCLLTGLTLLSGCATAPVAIERTAFPLRSFELLGRIGVSYESEGFHGNLRWRHEPEREEVWIMTPLGTGVAHLTQEAAGVTLVTSTETYRATDLSSLSRKVLGWSLPLDGLQYWVRGVAAPGESAAVERDSEGRLARLEQNGWRVDYLRYTPAPTGGLPAKLRLTSSGLAITLVIDSWSPGT